jgi:hypothetical protein
VSAVGDVVDRVVEALNTHDVDAFVACYAEDATIEDGRDTVLACGHDGVRERLDRILEEHPSARWEVLSRIESGPFVVQHEELGGRGDATRHVCVFLVEGDRIARELVLA